MMTRPVPVGFAPLAYFVVIDFSTTIAAGSVGSVTQKIDADSDFVVQSINMQVQTPGVILTSTLAGTPFPMFADASPGTAGNIMPTLGHFRLQINTAQVDWFSSPARVPLICGNGQLPGLFGTERSIAVGQDVRATLYNDTAALTCQGQLILSGYKYVRSGSRGLGT